VSRFESTAPDPALSGYLSIFDECAIAPTRRLIAAYVKGQLGGLARKSVMPMAREAGIPPRTLQELLSLHRWDEERMRQIVRERIQRLGADGVAILHESECPKKGTKTPGVDRQPLRGLGRSANACVISSLAVFHAELPLLADSELYLPPRWCQDRALRRAAGIPEELRYRSREELQLDMLERNWVAGLRFGLLVLEPGRALEPAWRLRLQSKGIPFAGEVSPRARGWTPKGRDSRVRPVEELIAAEGGVPPSGRLVSFLSEGAGAEDWPIHLAALRAPWSPQIRYVVLSEASGGFRAAERALSRASLASRVERDLGAVGFDHFEVRRYLSLTRHLVLSAASLLYRQAFSSGPEGASRPALRSAAPS
jgi:hypothetical protein